MRFILYTSVVLICLISGCKKEPVDRGRVYESIEEAYSDVTLDNGINTSEAKWLANTYFMLHISTCGGVTEIVNQGEKWEAKTVIGDPAQPYESIFIEKISGIINSTAGPTIKPASNEF